MIHLTEKLLCLGLFYILKRKGEALAVDIMSLFSCRWSQNLAEQISPWRPKLPGGCKLCVCAHWPLLKRATAGLLLNVRNRGPQLPLPCSLHCGGVHNARWSMNLILSRCLLYPKFKKNKKEKKPTLVRRVWGVQHPQRCTLFYFFFFWCFQGLQKIMIKTSYLNKGTEVGMHDQCHRLNNLILTFLAFVKGQSSARKRRILETHLILQWDFRVL